MEATANIPEALRQQPWHVTNPEREVTTLSILYFFQCQTRLHHNRSTWFIGPLTSCLMVLQAHPGSTGPAGLKHYIVGGWCMVGKANEAQ